MSSPLCDSLIDKGIAALRAQRHDEAIGALAEALELAPNDAEALSIYGLALLRAGRTADAEAPLARALALEPATAGFVMNHAEWLIVAGRTQEAIRAVRELTAREPARPRAWERLGDLLLQQGEAAQAAEAYDRMLLLEPASPIGPRKLGIALAAQRDWRRLEQLGQSWTQVDSRSAEAWRVFARAAWEQGLYEVARERYERALGLEPADARELATAAGICIQSFAFERAEQLLTQALRRDNRSPEALATQALLQSCLGRFDDAIDSARRCLAANPHHIPAYTLLSRLAPGRLAAAEVVLLDESLRDSTQPLEWRIAAAFALADQHHASGDPASAFAAYERANALARERNAAEGLRYDAAHIETRMALIRREFATLAPRCDDESPRQPQPLFIVGMPRSGTTLIESVLAAHSQVIAAGERPQLRQILDTRLAMGERGQAPGKEVRAAWIDSYCRELPAAAGARYVTDKNPLNIEAVGLIAELFPDSPIVLVRRDPLATAFSIFRHEFQKFWGFAHRLEDIGHYLGESARLTAHWQVLLGERLQVVQYEDFATDFPQSARSLLAACGLDWEEPCASFQSTARAVTTLSAIEVRSSVRVRNDAHLRYAPQLAALRGQLQRSDIDLVTGAWRDSA